MIIPIEKLLEQHSRFNLGNGFTTTRSRFGGWILYYKSKAIDVWETPESGLYPSDSELTQFPDVVSAMKAARGIIELRPIWMSEEASE
jgi:hypothetical protein